jgi:predicted O-linked N-acetylglucosamine transferase (SPINDLY family)
LSLLQHALHCQAHGQHEQAIEGFLTVLKSEPNNVVAWYSLASLYHARGEAAKALQAADQAIQFNAGFAPSYLARSIILSGLGRLQEALADAEKAHNLDAGLNGALDQLSRLQKAMPDNVPAKPVLTLDQVIAKAEILAQAGQKDLAIVLYTDYLQQVDAPLAYVACFNVAVLYSDTNRLMEAESILKRAISLNPGFLMGYLSLGIVMEKAGRQEGAIAAWQQGVALPQAQQADQKATAIKLLNNLGRLSEVMRIYDRAEAMLHQSLTIDPHQHDVLHHWIHLRQKQCKWPIMQGVALPPAEIKRYASPLAMLSLTDDPAEQLVSAKQFVREKVGQFTRMVPAHHRYGHDKIRIGYLSSDLSMHAVSLLTVELYETHDRNHFEVHAFCWSKEDGTPFRQRVKLAFDRFHAIGGLDDAAAAELIRANEIDIIVDLQGLTGNARPNIVARGPAPIQIAYLGYPGSSALPYVDYVVADPFIFPQELQPHFTEKPLYLPTVFQVSDSQRVFGHTQPRSFYGLPEEAFVFCAFNNNYKISQSMFECWLRILNQSTGSILWLLEDNPWSKEQLSQFALDRGVDPQRLVFAGRIDPKDYLTRFQAADVFLDTTPYNAGTTANDALWAGLPLITLSGRTYVSRMAGSLLTSAGLSQLICHDLETYEKKAVYYAQHRDKVTELKSHLLRLKEQGDLFNTRRFCHEFESALKILVEG